MKRILAMCLVFMMILAFSSCEEESMDESLENTETQALSESAMLGDTPINSGCRIAKWGVTVETVCANPSDRVYVDDKGMHIDFAENITAPGTSGEYQFNTFLKGNNEVSIQFDIVADVELSGWEAKGDYYCPLSVTVNGVTKNGNEFENVDDFEVWIEKASSVEKEYSAQRIPNDEEVNFSISWEWKFNDDQNDDQMDTILGYNSSALSFKISAIQTLTQTPIFVNDG